MSEMALPVKTSRIEGDRTLHGFLTLAVLVGLVVAASLVSLSSGPTGVGLGDLFAYLLGGEGLHFLSGGHTDKIAADGYFAVGVLAPLG